MKFRCFDIATMITDQVSIGLAPDYHEDPEMKSLFESRCGIIDRISDRFGTKEISVDVDDVIQEITIRIDCDAFDIDDSHDEFYDLARSCRRIVVRKSKIVEDGVSLDFVLNGFWVYSRGGGNE